MPRSFYARLHRHFGTTKSGYEQYKEAEQKLAELLERLPILSYIDRNICGSTDSEKPKKVAVIGAGFAGLSAAYTLKKAGFDVTVFESQDRIGGRVSSSNVTNSQIPKFRRELSETKLSEKVIEFGAELIGANHLLWLFFARKFGLGINLMTTEENFDLQGLKEPLCFGDKSILSDTWREIKSQMQKVVDKITQDANQIDNPFEPWTTPGADILDNISVYDMLEVYVKELIDEPLQKDILKYLKFEFENNNLTDPTDQSYLGLLSSIKGGGGDDYWEQTELFRCANGNASLAEALQKEIGEINNSRKDPGTEFEKNTIYLKKKLTTIEERGSELTLFFADGNKGEEEPEPFKCDYLILAIPTFKLKDITIQDENWKSSHSIKSGDAFKYITPLKERFWLKSNLSPSGSHENLGMLWEATDNQSVYNEDSENNYVLTVFSGGKTATDILKKSDTEVTKEIQKLIQKLYKDYPQPDGSKMLVNWKEIAGGGYSCPGLGEVTTSAKRLNEPFENNIFFAGEHTCMAFFGYMEGALQSGVMAAQKIAEQEKRKFDGLIVFHGKKVNTEYEIIMEGYHDKNDKLDKLWGNSIQVQGADTKQVERSDIPKAVGIFFQNNVYFAWRGHTTGDNIYPNIVQAYFEHDLDDLTVENDVKLKFSCKYTVEGSKEGSFAQTYKLDVNNCKTKHTPALVLYSNQLFMGWTTEAKGKIILAPIEIEGKQIKVGKPIIIGEQNPESKTGENEFISDSEINFASYKHKLYVTWISKDEKLKIAESVDGIQFHKVRTILVFKNEQSKKKGLLQPKSVALEVYDGKLYLAWINHEGKEIYVMTSKIEEGGAGVDFDFLDKIELSEESSGLSMTIYNQRLYLGCTQTNQKTQIYRTKKYPSMPTQEQQESLWFEHVSALEVTNEGALGLIGFAFQGIYGSQKK